MKTLMFKLFYNKMEESAKFIMDYQLLNKLPTNQLPIN